MFRNILQAFGNILQKYFMFKVFRQTLLVQSVLV